jgi:hypothetical protein
VFALSHLLQQKYIKKLVDEHLVTDKNFCSQSSSSIASVKALVRHIPFYKYSCSFHMYTIRRLKSFLNYVVTLIAGLSLIQSAWSSNTHVDVPGPKHGTFMLRQANV